MKIGIIKLYISITKVKKFYLIHVQFIMIHYTNIAGIHNNKMASDVKIIFLFHCHNLNLSQLIYGKFLKPLLW